MSYDAWKTYTPCQYAPDPEWALVCPRCGEECEDESADEGDPCTECRNGIDEDRAAYTDAEYRREIQHATLELIEVEPQEPEWED